MRNIFDVRNKQLTRNYDTVLKKCFSSNREEHETTNKTYRCVGVRVSIPPVDVIVSLFDAHGM